MHTRRTFLATAAVATVAVPTVLLKAQDAPKKRPKLKIGVKYSMVGVRGTPKQKFEVLKKLGFEGVEIDSPNNLDLDALNAASKETGIVIHGVIDSIHWNKPLSSPDEAVRKAGLDGLITAIEDAHKVGADTVLLVPGVVNDKVSYQQCWDRSTEEVKKAIPLAEKYKLKIAIETVWNNFITKPEQMVDYVDQFKTETVAAYFDISNMIKYGVTPADWIRKLGKRLVKFDFKGYNWDKAKAAKNDGEGFRVKIGEGTENWPEVLDALAEIGYDGWATSEVAGGDEKWLAEVAERMKKVLEL